MLLFRICFFSFLITGSLHLAQASHPELRTLEPTSIDSSPLEPLTIENPIQEPAHFEPEVLIEDPQPTLLELSTTLTLSEIVELALSHHPLTKQAKWQVESSKTQLGMAKSAYYPQVNLQAHAERGKTFQYTNGPDLAYTTTGVDLVLSMLLYDFGQREAEIASFQWALKSAHYLQDWATQKVIIDVLESAYQSLHQEELVACAKISFEDAQKMLHVARTLNHSGLVSISDVYLAEATLAQMHIQLLEQEARRDIQSAKLAIKIGLDPKSSFKLTPIEKLPAPKKQEVDTLISLGLTHRTDLLAQQAQAARSESEHKRAKAAHYPKLSLSASGGSNRALHDQTKSDQYTAGIKLDLPLFDGFKTSYNQQNAYAQARIADQETEALQEQISLNILSQVRELQALEQMMPQSEKLLVSCHKAHDSVQERYSAGRTSISELSTSLQQLANARIRHSEMNIRWMIALSTLAYVTGTLSHQTTFTETP